jgi:hypothetical protein
MQDLQEYGQTGMPNQAVQQAVGMIMQENGLPMTQAGMQAAGQQLGAEAGAAAMAPQIVEKAQDFRLYLRYRF